MTNSLNGTKYFSQRIALRHIFDAVRAKFIAKSVGDKAKKAALILYVLVANFAILLAQKYPNDAAGEKYMEEYMKIVREHCGAPEIIDIERSLDGYVEIEFLCGGEKIEIGIKDMQMIYLERPIAREEVPFDKIESKLEKQYEGWAIDEIARIETNDTSFIKVEVVQGGIEQNLYFTNDGKWYKAKPTAKHLQFDAASLEQNTKYLSARYNLNSPHAVYELPDLLREISGIEIRDSSAVYCIQDEIGAVFEYDLAKNEVVKSHRFIDYGDFEDIAVDGSTAYILRSDGCLFACDLSGKLPAASHIFQFNSLNIEGLDYSDGYLYFASKAPLLGKSEDERVIFKVKSDNYGKIEEYLVINRNELMKFIADNYKEITVLDLEFNPSAIAFHPITKELFVLSAHDRLLAIYSGKRLVNVLPLSPEIYHKPEGIDFYDNGDMLISSEGDKKGIIKGTINLIKYE